MKIIKQPNLEEFIFSRGRFQKNQEFFDLLCELEVKDVIEFLKEDLRGKYTSPHGMISNAKFYKKLTGKKFSVRTLAGKEKWIIIRTQ